ncbi:unnamed protein product [Lactuca virosa]|uniref:SNF2 N-terminal domain-containing protein n=1 Tax=Lactuca virosa TaxID=75947 RepID=A0AAU9N2C6_9ASTR|nr:unnamed protein product [Lactuca virosa]
MSQQSLRGNDKMHLIEISTLVQLLHRRLKSEVFRDNDATNTAKLSKKNEIIDWLRLSKCQRQLYEGFLNSEIVLSAFDGSPLPALTPDTAEKYDIGGTHDKLSCKIFLIMSLLEKLIPEGHKVLIFSQTRKMVNLIQFVIAADAVSDGEGKVTDCVK